MTEHVQVATTTTEKICRFGKSDKLGRPSSKLQTPAVAITASYMATSATSSAAAAQQGQSIWLKTSLAPAYYQQAIDTAYLQEHRCSRHAAEGLAVAL